MTASLPGTNDLGTRALTAALRLEGQPELPVTALLRHRAAEPDLVQLVLVLDDEPLDIPLDRALLVEGLRDGAAHGDVQVQVHGKQVLLGVGDLDLSLPLAPVVELLLNAQAPRVVDLQAGSPVRG